MSESKAITTRMLEYAPKGAFLYCRKCGARYSADHHDYSFWRDPDESFECCGVLNRLVVERKELIDV